MSYMQDAKNRASRRKSRWNLLLLLVVLFWLVLIWIVAILLAAQLHSSIYPAQSLRTGVGAGPILTTVSPFFGSLFLAMLLGNLAVSRVPAARRTLDRESGRSAANSFEASQTALCKIAVFLVPASAVACVAGALLPWQ